MQSLPRYKFLEGFSRSVNEKHFSSTVEAAKFLDEIIAPFVKRKRESKSLSSDHKFLVIFDVFKGQMTHEVLKILAKNHILVTTVTTVPYHGKVLPALRCNGKWIRKNVLSKTFE